MVRLEKDQKDELERNPKPKGLTWYLSHVLQGKQIILAALFLYGLGRLLSLGFDTRGPFQPREGVAGGWPGFSKHLMP